MCAKDGEERSTLDLGSCELARRRKLALEQGGKEKVEKQHSLGRLTARERIDMLFDPGSFVEVGMLAHSDVPEVGERAPGDAVVTGVGRIDGRKVTVVAYDRTVLGGSLGRVGMRKQAQIAYLSVRKGCPFVILGEADGGRVPDVMGSSFAGVLGDYTGESFLYLRDSRVRVPRVVAILGPAYADPSLIGAVSDLVVLEVKASMSLVGAPVLAAVGQEHLTDSDLGGQAIAASVSGVAHLVLEGEQECIAAVRRFLSYLPSNSTLCPPVAPPTMPGGDLAALRHLVPEDLNRAYDMRRVLETVLDRNSFFEMRRMWGTSVIVGLGRVEGEAVGVIASQPLSKAGALDCDASSKARDMIDLCDGFGLPLVFFQDVPGVLIGLDSERKNILRHAMELFSRLAVAKVPKVTIVLRKAYGLAWILMGGSPMGTDYVAVWPNARIGFMGHDLAVSVVYPRRIEEIRKAEGEESAKALRRELAAEMERSQEPWTAAGSVFIHQVIEPEETRQAIVDGLFIGKSYVR
jgi:acetyl-CoA carboxylase carboxyltransferase component